MIVGDYMIKFYHNTKNNHVDIKSAKKDLTAKEYKEFIKDIDKCCCTVELYKGKDNFILRAKSVCSLEDNYNRAIGRGLALHKLLSNLDLNPEYTISSEDKNKIVGALNNLPRQARNNATLANVY